MRYWKYKFYENNYSEKLNLFIKENFVKHDMDILLYEEYYSLSPNEKWLRRLEEGPE